MAEQLPGRRPVFSGAHHEVFLDAKRLAAAVVGTDGAPWFTLRLLHAVDATDGIDETLGSPQLSVTEQPGATVLRVVAASSRWEHRWTELRCDADGFSLTGGVRGHGSVLQVHAFAGYRPPSGFLPSGSALRSAVSPNPDHPRRIVRDAVEPATIAVTGSGAEPGVGRWLFTPAPWCLAVSRSERAGDQQPPAGEWAWLGLLAPIEQQTFTALHYLPGPEGFSVRLEYEGHTRVDGEFTVPRIDIRFGAADPIAAIAAHSAAAREFGRDAAGPDPLTAGDPVPAVPDWWREPMFCGWGAQRALAEHDPGGNRHAPDWCTQANYDAFLGALAAGGVTPGTVVVDDKWSLRYATCTPDPERWPDLAGWIRARQRAGQRVLLWWKAWDPDGAPPEACIRLPDGTPVAVDPDSEAGAALVSTAVTGMLSASGLGADGLKIDFTASTPSGAALRSAGPRWGAALLHRLLQLVYRAAKAARPDALIITHTPNPAFADVTDMLRLNDAMMLDSPDPSVDVPSHMAFRAAVVRAAMPGTPIDTDGWCMPDRPGWRSYVALQPSLGVPALYYADGFDRTTERLTNNDHRLLRDTWRAYRESLSR
ncbi:MAG TPA: hypothetical protein VFM01_09365 [Nakamurella sp.]|nr:hypothetical protein [Nakamurella sp.]